jgi:GTP-binding protein
MLGVPHKKVDARSGPSGVDQEIAAAIRRLGKPTYLVMNKTEQLDSDIIGAEFYSLGLGKPYAISASHGQGIEALMETVLAGISVTPYSLSGLGNEAASIRLAVVGRPNVGKSTLVNRLLGEERVLTSDRPGTTRDSITIPFEKNGQRYALIDTAGIRRRSRVAETIEKFSIVKTLQSIEQAHVVILLLDGHQGIVEQDATLLGLIMDRGRALVIAVNKWDHLPQDKRVKVRQDLARKLSFLDFADIHFISALQGSGVMDLLPSVDKAYQSAHRKLSTPELNRILEDAVASHQPPLVHGHRCKLRYAHQGGENPPLIIIHGNRTHHIPDSYKRYLINSFRRLLDLRGTPLRLQFRGGENPYRPRQPA